MCDRQRAENRLIALQWLVQNNIYYRDVTIDHGVLALLPVDGELTNLCTMRMLSTEVDTAFERHNEDPSYAHLGSTFVPIPARGVTEQEAINQTIMQSGNCTPVRWPSTSGSPINEFTTEGYMSCAFPTLFPTGAALLVFIGERSNIWP